MIRGEFEHRSGRVISFARVALSSILLFAVWIDPTQPTRYPDSCYIVLASHLAIGTLYLSLTWHKWWLEHRLAPWALAGDIATFGLLVFLTDGYTSPFFTFFMFIVLSAAIKWGWRETALSALAVILIFFLAGLAALGRADADLDMMRLMVRATYLVVLSFLLIWFGVNQGARRSRRRRRLELVTPDQPASLSADRVLDHATMFTGGMKFLFIWWSKEEPWINLEKWEDGRKSSERHGPEAFGNLVAAGLEGKPFVFEQKRGRALLRQGSGRKLHHLVAPLNPELEARLGDNAGIAVPVDSSGFSGLILGGGIPGLCTDDLEIAERLADDVSAALERFSVVALSAEAAANRTRLSLARDLHDSVIQLLAGTSFRLEGLKAAAADAQDIGQDIEALQRELSIEQKELREIIKELRGFAPNRQGALCDSLEAVIARLADQWKIECRLLRCPPGLFPSPELRHGVHQLVRESVANAVRHGSATEVSIAIDGGEAGISLVVSDNGHGFAPREFGKDGFGDTVRPWSLNERVHELGGMLSLHSTQTGSRIIISLPAQEAR